MPVMAATSAQVSCLTRTPTTRGRQGREIASREQIIPVVETRAGNRLFRSWKPEPESAKSSATSAAWTGDAGNVDAGDETGTAQGRA
jgi:hypothetical protein